MREARGLACGRCGGVTPVTSLAPRLTCPFCNGVIVVPEPWLAELRSYGAHVAASVGEARGEEQRAASWEAWSGPDRPPPSQSILLGMGLMLGLPIATSMLFGVAFMSGLVPPQMAPLGSFAAMGAFVVGMVVYTWRTQIGTRARASHAAVHGELVACSRCGAPNPLAAGRAVDICGHCRAPVLPSATMVRDVLAEADALLLRARMQRYRAERAGAAYVRGFSAAGVLVYIVVGPWAAMALIGAIAFTAEALTSKVPANPVALGLVWLFALSGLALLGGVFRFRADRRRRTEAALDAIGRTFTGRRADASAAVAWLNMFWAAPIDLTVLYTGSAFGSAIAQAAGYPALLWVDPVPMTPSHTPRLVLFVAAVFSGNHRPIETPRSFELDERLRHLGFDIERNEGGLVATAQPPLVQRVQKRPDLLVTLAPAIETAGALAAELRGVPVTPIP